MRLMDSMPPPTAKSYSPTETASAAETTACMPEAQALLIVCAGTPSGRPAARPTCRAGLGPDPACRACPIHTSPTSAGSTPARWSASRVAAAPRVAACTSRKPPP